MGTIKAKSVPFVVLTSNRARPLSEALRRRCAYLYIEYPDMEKELAILRAKLPHVDDRLCAQVALAVHKLLQYVYFVKYTGQYLVTENVLSGTYDDGKAWGASYTVTLGADGQTIELVNSANIDDISIFAKSTVPQDVIDSAVSMTSRGEEIYMLDRFL